MLIIWNSRDAPLLIGLSTIKNAAHLMSVLIWNDSKLYKKQTKEFIESEMYKKCGIDLLVLD